MPTEQGSPALLNDPIAQELLRSTRMARLAYTWNDGTPRVIPIWFHWDGTAVVLGTPVTAPKMHVLPHNSKVALTIDTEEWPYKVLLIRGTAAVETVDGVVPEYAAAAERYFGVDQGRAWVENMGKMPLQMARIAIRPEWVGIIDFEQRFPSAVEKAMSA